MIICTFEDGKKTNLRHVVMHAIAEKEGKILLVKRAESLTTEPGKWGFPGGFLDIGEDIKEGVLRELQEETGWSGRIVSLFRVNSNPKRPNEFSRGNVAMEFIVEALDKVSEPDSESSKVEWIKIEDIRLDELAFDFKEALELYFKYKKGEINIPII